MKFVAHVVLGAMLGAGCAAHQSEGVDAFVTAIEVLVVAFSPTGECALPQDSGGTAASADVQGAQDAFAARVLYTVFCGTDVHSEALWRVREAQEGCRAVWQARNQSPEALYRASAAMMDAKEGIELLVNDCGGSEEEQALASDFYAHVWKPDTPWSWRWDGCFGTPLERLRQGGVVLDED